MGKFGRGATFRRSRRHRPIAQLSLVRLGSAAVRLSCLGAWEMGDERLGGGSWEVGGWGASQISAEVGRERVIWLQLTRTAAEAYLSRAKRSQLRIWGNMHRYNI